MPLSKTLSDAVYWLVLLLFLPAALGALGIEGLLTPVQNLVGEVLGFLPNILAAGLINRDRERSVMKDSIEDTGRHVVHELERYLETLGTIAAISPLLGLLGTVIGMVKVFTAITTHGVGNPTVLAGGIAEALITTAAGLTVVIPALIGFRYYRNRVDTLVVDMEKEAIKLVEALHRRQEKANG